MRLWRRIGKKGVNRRDSQDTDHESVINPLKREKRNSRMALKLALDQILHGSADSPLKVSTIFSEVLLVGLCSLS